MPVMPRAGQIARRDQKREEKRDQMESMTQQQRMQLQQQQMMRQQMQQQQEQMRQQHLQHQRMAQRGGPGGMQQPLSAEQRHALRREGQLTEAELAEGVEDGSKSGRGFRLFFIGLVAAVLGLLFLVKIDQEVGIEMPDALKKMAEEDQGSNLNSEDQAQFDQYLKDLDVNKPATDGDDGTLTKEQRKLRRRRDKEELRKQLKEKSKQHDDKYAVVACGASCQSEGKQIQAAMEMLDQQVDSELYTSLFPGEGLDSVKGRSKKEINKAYEKRKADIEAIEVEEGSEAETDKQLMLQDLSQAKDILGNTESRAYYELYGLKPPEAMRKTSARNGGWGQELLLRTHFHKLILAWMSFFDNSGVDLFVVLFVFTCLFLAPALARLPQTVAMAQRMTQEWEDMAELEKKAKGGK